MMAAAFVMGGTIGVTVNPPSANGYIAGGGTSDVSTGSILAAGQGGVAPYTYSWAQVGATPYTWTIGTASAASTNFTAHSLPQGVSDTATFRVTVTDSAGASGTAEVVATAFNDTFRFDGFFF